MPYPTPIVQIAFTDGPYVVSPTWTDVTAYVTQLDITRGRTDDWGTYSGNAQIELLNNDRRFDPFNTSGPYYGKLLPRRQIRIRAVANSVTYDVFRGYIDGWPPMWTEAGKMSTVTLSCFDALELLGSSTVPADWAHQYILSLNPQHYWWMNEPVNAFSSTLTSITDYGSEPFTIKTAAPNCEDLAPGLPSSIGNSGILFQFVKASGMTGLYDMTISAWINFNGYDTSGWPLRMQDNGYMVELTLLASGQLRVQIRAMYPVGPAATVYQFTTTDKSYGPGVPYMATITWVYGIAAIGLYINGQSVTGTSTTAMGTLARTADIIISADSVIIQQLAVWKSTILTASQINQIYQLSQALFPETTSARVTRLIQQTPFSTLLLYTTPNPVANVLTIGDDAATISSELQRTADTEYGPLFVGKDGIIQLLDQNAYRTQTRSLVSQVTYGVGGLPLDREITLEYDGDSVRNIANISYHDASTLTTTNSTSVAAYGQAQESVQTYSQDASNMQTIGNIVSGWGGQVYPAASEFEVVLSPNESWQSTLALDLTDRITLAVQPPTGNVITIPMLVNQIRHSATPGRWQTFLQGSARWAASFILGTSTLDSTDLLG